MANCMIRGSLADLMRPKSGLVRVAMGGLKFVVLNRLNASALNSNSCVGEKGLNFRLNATSTVQKPGALRLFRFVSPNVPIAGSSNAAVSNHRSDVGFDTSGSPT